MFIGYTTKRDGRKVYSDTEGNHEFDSTRAAMAEMVNLVTGGKTDAAWLCEDDGKILASVTLDWNRTSYIVTPPTAMKQHGYRVGLPPREAPDGVDVHQQYRRAARFMAPGDPADAQ